MGHRTRTGGEGRFKRQRGVRRTGRAPAPANARATVVHASALAWRPAAGSSLCSPLRPGLGLQRAGERNRGRQLGHASQLARTLRATSQTLIHTPPPAQRHAPRRPPDFHRSHVHLHPHPHPLEVVDLADLVVEVDGRRQKPEPTRKTSEQGRQRAGPEPKLNRFGLGAKLQRGCRGGCRGTAGGVQQAAQGLQGALHASCSGRC